MGLKEELQKIRERAACYGVEFLVAEYRSANELIKTNERLITCVERLVEGLENIADVYNTSAEEFTDILIKDISAILTGESEKGDGG